jgi:excisionase family DNA binding protein
MSDRPQPAEGDDALLTTAEVAARLRVTEETVRRLARSGRLPGFVLSAKVGWRFPKQAVDSFIAAALQRQQERRDERG